MVRVLPATIGTGDADDFKLQVTWNPPLHPLTPTCPATHVLDKNSCRSFTFRLSSHIFCFEKIHHLITVIHHAAAHLDSRA